MRSSDAETIPDARMRNWQQPQKRSDEQECLWQQREQRSQQGSILRRAKMGTQSHPAPEKRNNSLTQEITDYMGKNKRTNKATKGEGGRVFLKLERMLT